MRPTVWTLLLAMLLQLLAGNAWAWRATPAQTQALTPSCHERVVPVGIAAHVADAAHAADAAHLTDATQAASVTVHDLPVHGDSHHCCAVGLGVGVPALLLPLPQAAPVSAHGPWASLSLRPDLRPPI